MDEPSIETLMLTRFLEAAPPREILLWHKAHLDKAIELARGAEREKLIEWLSEHDWSRAVDALRKAGIIP